MAGKIKLIPNQLQVTGEGSNDQSSGDKMADLIGRLKLTSEESRALEVVDDVEDELATSDCAIIGKVLSQGVLHIQTIMSALRPAWGNPKGLTARTVGANLFIAEFGSKHDKDRVLDGSPWMLGGNKKAVLVQDFDASMRPSDIHFKHMSVWTRIYNLPFGWMNKKWGEKIAEMVGSVEKIDVDDQDRAWGPYLRAKVKIDISKPLLRAVSLFSVKRQTKELYKVRYEKLPSFCYSCGIIGHSSLECRTPAERDENGKLPYSEELRVSEDNKKKGSEDLQNHLLNSVRKNGSAVRGHDSGTSYGGLPNSQGKGFSCYQQQGQEPNNEKDVRKAQHKTTKTTSTSEKEDGKEIVQDTKHMIPNEGKKRKQVLNYDNADEGDCMDMAIVVYTADASRSGQDNGDEHIYEEETEMVKKQKMDQNTILTSSAAAGSQPRREP